MVKLGVSYRQIQQLCDISVIYDEDKLMEDVLSLDVLDFLSEEETYEIYTTVENFITVKDELEHAKSYLFIQSIRYANAFKYEFDIDPEVVEFTTMKLILQPLIENAIYHGLKNRIDEGELKISAKLINSETGVITKSVTTDSNGTYTFTGVQNGR